MSMKNIRTFIALACTLPIFVTIGSLGVEYIWLFVPIGILQAIAGMDFEFFKTDYE